MPEGNDYGPLALALAKAQAAFPAIARDRTVKVQTRTGGSYTFNYAPLDTILAAVRGPLAANELAISQLIDGTDLVTMLLHSSGASLSGRAGLPQNGTVQELGSAITYLRRYSLQAILGIASEEDDDGNAASGNRADTAPRNDQERRQPPQAPSAPPRAPAPVSVASDAGQRPQLREFIGAAPGLAPADVADLHANYGQTAAPFTPGELVGIETPGMSTPELFARAEEVGVSKAQITLSAKSMFGANRWKVTDLTDDERAALWDEVRPA